MLPDSKIYVAGHNGLAGSAIWRELEHQGFTNIFGRRSSELDLTETAAVDRFFDAERPEYVFLAAAKVGGIKANNDFPGDFLFRNLAIQNNVIDAARRFGVRKLLFPGSSCIYPKLAPQPLKEEYLLTGPLEPTNESGTPSPRSLASSSARPVGASMDATSSPPCRRTSMVPATTTIRWVPTFCLR